MTHSYTPSYYSYAHFLVSFLLLMTCISCRIGAGLQTSSGDRTTPEETTAKQADRRLSAQTSPNADRRTNELTNPQIPETNWIAKLLV